MKFLLFFFVVGCRVATLDESCVRQCDADRVGCESTLHNLCAHCVEAHDGNACPDQTDTKMDLATCETTSDAQCSPTYDSCTEACIR